MLCKEDDISDDKKRKIGQHWFLFLPLEVSRFWEINTKQFVQNTRV